VPRRRVALVSIRLAAWIPNRGQPSRMTISTEITVHVDGAARGNPGPAAYGVAIETAAGEPVAAFARYLGETTNNFAEYQGLLAALSYALEQHYLRVCVVTDSELMARQINGQYKVRSPDLKPLHEKAQAMIRRLERFSIRHVLREHNREADRLANQALDAAERGSARATAARGMPSPHGPHDPDVKPLCVSATFRNGVLKPHAPLPLSDGEEVELEIRRRT